MPAPHQALEEQVEYLGVQRDAGCTPEELELLATASKDSFLSVLADVDEVQRVHATTMIRMLMSSVFTMAHHSEIIWAINLKVGVRMVNQTHAKQALQSFMYFHNYPTKDLFAVMQDPAKTLPHHSPKGGTVLKRPWCYVYQRAILHSDCSNLDGV